MSIAHGKSKTIFAGDTAASLMFAASLLLIVLNSTAASIVAHRGLAYLWVVEISLLLTGAFAIAGIVFGVMRSFRMTKSQS